MESDIRHHEVSWNDFLHRNGRVRLKIAYFISVHSLDTYYDTFSSAPCIWSLVLSPSFLRYKLLNEN